MTNTMVTDHEAEALIAQETGHELGCFEIWMETALESDADPDEIYALWYQETSNGFRHSQYGFCECTDTPEE
jgi:hypothetical protein